MTASESLALHSLLLHLDPEMGARWHWKDSRKVLRSLEIIKESGKLASAGIREQSGQASLPRYDPAGATNDDVLVHSDRMPQVSDINSLAICGPGGPASPLRCES
jgi:hypothetical protein